MFKRNGSYMLLAGVTLLGSGSIVSAATTVGSLNTDLSATFTDDTSTTSPVDPTDPTKPVKPDRPGTTGPLSLDAAPTSINFGSKQLSAGNDLTLLSKPMKITYSDDTTKEVPNYVQVTDKRGGRLGWKLTVNQLDQLKTDGNVKLDGAVISLNDQQIISSSTETAPGGFSGKLDLTPGSDVTVMTAQKGQGYLTWIQKYGSVVDDGTGKANVNNGIKLFVPSGAAQASKYTGQLKWSLIDAPA